MAFEIWSLTLVSPDLRAYAECEMFSMCILAWPLDGLVIEKHYLTQVRSLHTAMSVWLCQEAQEPPCALMQCKRGIRHCEKVSRSPPSSTYDGRHDKTSEGFRFVL